jgi:two-component system sensor histidine kinase BaeS
VVSALLLVGLTRIGARQRALAELSRTARSVAELASGLPCPATGAVQPEVRREFGPDVRFIPDTGLRRRQALAAPQGRLVVGGRQVLFASAPVTICGRSGRLAVFRPTASVPALPQGFATRLLVAAVIALLAATGVAFFLARRLSRPLGELASSARSLARGGGDVIAVNPSDPAEVADVKEAFGGMARDLSSAREREKSFLLSVSHELRTPLTAIRGYGEALADGTATDARKAGAVVVRESQRLERLVQDLMDLARFESGEFSVHAVGVDLATVASDVVDSLQPTAEEAGVTLTSTGSGSKRVQTDPDRVHQMVANLIENALRVTPRGGSVTVEVSDASIAVQDSGPGLDGEDLERAFERFYLWRKYRGDRPVGSGLGLAIVAELAHRLGAKIGVQAAPGEGSRFELSFHS